MTPSSDLLKFVEIFICYMSGILQFRDFEDYMILAWDPFKWPDLGLVNKSDLGLDL